MGATFSCFNCGDAMPIVPGDPVRLRDTGPKCDADLHVCMNCRFYDTSAHNQCRETQAEWVRYKDQANHCDYFEPLPGAGRAGAGGRKPDAADAARKKFDDLFKL